LIRNPRTKRNEHKLETCKKEISVVMWRRDRSPRRGNTETKLYPTKLKKAIDRSGCTPQRKIVKEMGSRTNSKLM